MLGTRLTALILAALSVTTLRAQDKTATANASSGAFTSQIKPRPPIGEPQIADSPVKLPPVIHLCIARCFPVMWDKGHYVNFGPENTSIYTIESFTRESIILHRTDKGHFPLTADMTGQMSDDGNSIVNGRIVWTSGNSGSGPFRAVWGKAILYQEQSDQDEGQRRILNIPCDASSRVSIAEASERAEQLLEADDLTTATCWMRIGATQGDAQAQGALASIMYRGVGVPVNIPEAALWAEKASAQNYYLGEHVLSNMYASGVGKPKDPAKAEFWRARYEKDELANDRAEQQAQEARQQRVQAQAQQNWDAHVMMLKILLKAFSVDSDNGSSSASWPNRYEQLKAGCAGGSSNACAQSGGTPPE